MSGFVLLTDRQTPPTVSGLRPMSLDELNEAEALDEGAVLVDAHNTGFAHAALAAMRLHTSPGVYLKPVFLVGREAELDRRPRAAADLVIAPEDLDEYRLQRLADTFGSWQTRMRTVSKAAAASTDCTENGRPMDTGPAVKFLRFLYVRNESATPVRGTWSMAGYHYPKLAYFLTADNLGILRTLEYLEAQGLLRGEFHDKAHFCAHCNSAFLNFRETCPHCQSANLAVDDLIHHFRCGHVAPKAEFTTSEGGFTCPKCNRDLNHLGTDYDKPSAVYTCRDCGHVFQEPDVSAACYNCGHTAAPEEHIHHEIKAFALTSLGESAAIHGLDSMFREILTERLHVVSMETFKVFLEIEINRITRYKKSESSVIFFHIADLFGLQADLGDKARSLFGEISDSIAKTLRTSDIITPLSDSTYVALLVETPLQGADIATRRIDDNLSALLSANMDMDVEIRTRAFPIKAGDDRDAILATVMDHANAR